MDSHFRYVLDSLRERLWVKPTVYAILAVISSLAAGLADTQAISELVPDISAGTIEALVTIITASMLGVSTFAVASMVSAYAAASRGTTPRAFSLLVKDRASQNALSSFIGAFIFSVAGMVAIKVEYYGAGGRFALFVLVLGVMAWVIVTFVRWVDQIARLGRLGNTVDRVEDATLSALEAWGSERSLGALPDTHTELARGTPVYPTRVGHVRHVDVEALQEIATERDLEIRVASGPGTLATLDRPLLHYAASKDPIDDEQTRRLEDAFVLADTRTFTQDPRLGFISLSEIASRAMSPAVNDPGTAIECISRLVKIFSHWQRDVLGRPEQEPVRYDRVRMPRMSIDDLFEDAFGAIARDAAACVEVSIRLQKGLASLGALGDSTIREAAEAQARLALARALEGLSFAPDRARVRAAATLVE